MEGWRWRWESGRTSENTSVFTSLLTYLIVKGLRALRYQTFRGTLACSLPAPAQPGAFAFLFSQYFLFNDCPRGHRRYENNRPCGCGADRRAGRNSLRMWPAQPCCPRPGSCFLTWGSFLGLTLLLGSCPAPVHARPLLDCSSSGIQNILVVGNVHRLSPPTHSVSSDKNPANMGPSLPSVQSERLGRHRLWDHSRSQGDKCMGKLFHPFLGQ